MLSPHTPPGTRVAFVRAPKSAYNDDGLLAPQSLIAPGTIDVLVGIKPCSLTGSGYYAALAGMPNHGVCLSILRRVDLPECLTSLLNVAPTDSGADKSITVED